MRLFRELSESTPQRLAIESHHTSSSKAALQSQSSKLPLSTPKRTRNCLLVSKILLINRQTEIYNKISEIALAVLHPDSLVVFKLQGDSNVPADHVRLLKISEVALDESAFNFVVAPFGDSSGTIFSTSHTHSPKNFSHSNNPGVSQNRLLFSQWAAC